MATVKKLEPVDAVCNNIASNLMIGWQFYCSLHQLSPEKGIDAAAMFFATVLCAAGDDITLEMEFHRIKPAGDFTVFAGIHPKGEKTQ